MAQIKCSVCGFDYENSFSACPNCGNPTPAAPGPQPGASYNNAAQRAPRYQQPQAPAAPRSGSEFGNQILDAVIHFFYRIVYFLFILPFDLWKKAIIRLSEQRRNHSLEAAEIKSEWPFCSWLKRFVFEFLLDGLTLISWVVGLIIIFSQGELKYMSFGEVVMVLYCIYIIPIMFSLLRDILTLCVVLPIRWWVSFFKRPAKTYDLTHVGTIKKD